MPLTVMLACNDPNSGAFAGRVIAAAFDDGARQTVLKLDSPDYPMGPGLALRFLDGPGRFNRGEATDRIRLAGREFPILGRTAWVGNWCWDAVKVRDIWIPHLIEHLREHKWQADEGDEALFTAYECGFPIAAAWRAIKDRAPARSS